METKYPTLRRPKRKLCYLTNKESPPKQWASTPTLGDVDRMFDDLNASLHDDDDLQTSDSGTSQSQKEAPPVPQEGQLTEKLPGCQMAPEEDVLHPATRSPSPKLDLDLDFPFKAHVPVKTSSPIEENLVVEGVEELNNEKDRVLSPILFACEGEGEEEAKTEPPPTKKPQCNGHITEQSDDSEFESPPSKVALSRPKMSSHKKQAEGTCKESLPVKEKATKGPQTADRKDKREAPRQEHIDPPASAERQEPEVAAPKKKSESVQGQPSVEVSPCVGKDMSTFLQKLRDAGQPKPACSRKSPVKVPTPPEPDDDFLILEDDTPLWFSIPSKTATNKRQKQSRTSSTDKDSSTDKGAKESPLETAEKQQESEQPNSNVASQPVNQKMKKVKGKEKKNEETEPGNNMDDLSSPEDLPADEQDKPNKKKQRLKKVPSKESDNAEEQPEDTASSETDKEKPALKMEKKAQKSSDMKRSKSLKDGNENAKTSRAKSLKGARKMTQGSDAVKKTVHVETMKEQNEEDPGAEDLGSLSDKEIVNSEAQTHKKDKRNKLPVGAEESSPEDSQILGRRRRKQTGQWWLSTDEAKVTDNQPALKKSRQNNNKPNAAAPSPVKTKKDRVLKRSNQTQPAPSSSQNPNEAKEKKSKQNKNRKTRGDAPDKVKASEEVFDAMEAEQVEEQEILDQDLDPVESSPLAFAQRDHSFNTDKEIVNSEAQTHKKDKQNKLPVGAEESSPEDSQILVRRRRKQTGQWWLSKDEAKVTDNQPALKKSRQNNKKPNAAVPSPVKTKKDRVLKRSNQTQPAPSSSQNPNEAKEKKSKQNKNRKTRGDAPDKVKASEEVFDAMEAEQVEEQEQEILDQDLDPVESSPLAFAQRDHSFNTGDQVFPTVYHHVSNRTMSTTPAPVSPRVSRKQLRAADPEKRRRKPPIKWWTVNALSEDVESISSQPQQQEPKPRKQRKKRSEQSRSPGLGTPKNVNMAVSSKPPGGAPVPLSTPKTVKRSLATFKDIFTSATDSPTMVRSREAGQNNRCKVAAHPAVEVTVTDCSTHSKTDEHILTMDVGEPNSPPNHESPQDSKCQSENTLKPLRSGPSSMIELELYEENDDLILPSSRIHPVLSASDLCAPPLKPLTLQPKDKANLTEWFKSLWSTTDNGPEITPDQFDWYFYQGRAIGFLVDLNCGSICNGKILLGSYTKKPLWVDHSATTVFNLLTSSVSVTIDVTESRFNPGQSFMVPCGRAYSIRNVTSQPAVLYFTRILAETSD